MESRGVHMRHVALIYDATSAYDLKVMTGVPRTCRRASAGMSTSRKIA
jgi:hypothetical protein